MVSLRKRPFQDRIDRIKERLLLGEEVRLREAKGRKPWLQKKLQRLKGMLVLVEAECRKDSGGTDDDWRSQGHRRKWRTIKARRRRRQRNAAAERRAMALYLAECPWLDVIEEGRRAREEKMKRRRMRQ